MSHFVVLFIIVFLIIYPIWGGVMYADPWKWPLKSQEPPQ